MAGDVAEQVADVEWALRLLRERFARVIWVPGNHELWTRGQGSGVAARGAALPAPGRDVPVDRRAHPGGRRSRCGTAPAARPRWPRCSCSTTTPSCRTAPRPASRAWTSRSRPGWCAPTSTCCTRTRTRTGPAWCAARVRESARRLAACDPQLPTVLVNHWPLTRLPTRVLRHPEFALWCGTVATADWHRRYRATAVVYGHLHIPRVTWEDGVRVRGGVAGLPARMAGPRAARRHRGRRPAAASGAAGPAR